MNMTKAQLLQKDLFDAILRKEKSDGINELCELLHLKRSAIYKRLNGQKQLTLDELLLLSEHYQFSIDKVLSNTSGKAIFDFPALNGPPRSYEEFYGSILNDMEIYSQIPGCRVSYVSTDIPIFHYFYFPELTAFKMFIWSRTNWEWPSLERAYFSSQTLLKQYPVAPIYRRMLDIYLDLPSIELWNANILDNTINQIQYYASSGIFKEPKEAYTLCKQLHELVEHFMNMAYTGRKFMPGDSKRKERGEFQLYHNEITYCTNIVLAETDHGNLVFANYDNPNFMRSREENVINYTIEWFTKLKRRSLKISGEGERNRVQFFRTLENRVWELERYLEQLLG
ncbi:MAG: hypothetical protein AAFP19_18040 [Bacteroidota bacterium]